MSNEIKEILDDLKNYANEGGEHILMEYEIKHIQCYITNLQEENVVLKSQLLQDNKSYYDMQDRIKKAIEKLKDLYSYADNEEYVDNYCKDLLKTLQGKSDE